MNYSLSSVENERLKQVRETFGVYHNDCDFHWPLPERRAAKKTRSTTTATAPPSTGTTRRVGLPVLDVTDFNERIIRGYEEGYGETELPADLSVARSLIPAGTASLRDFSYIAPEIPEYIPRTAPAAWTA